MLWTETLITMKCSVCNEKPIDRIVFLDWAGDKGEMRITAFRCCESFDCYSKITDKLMAEFLPPSPLVSGELGALLREELWDPLRPNRNSFG